VWVTAQAGRDPISGELVEGGMAGQMERSNGRLGFPLMTTLVAMLGLFPAAVSNGIGAQTQKPLAIVVIGGSLFGIIGALIAIPLAAVIQLIVEETVYPRMDLS